MPQIKLAKQDIQALPLDANHLDTESDSELSIDCMGDADGSIAIALGDSGITVYYDFTAAAWIDDENTEVKDVTNIRAEFNTACDDWGNDYELSDFSPTQQQDFENMIHDFVLLSNLFEIGYYNEYAA